MKKLKFLAILFAIAFFVCCSSPEKQNNNSELSETVDDHIPFAGSWVNEEYLNSIRQFKSPKQAQGEALFTVMPDKMQQHTMMITGFHEGGPYLEVVKGLHGFELWYTEGTRALYGIIEIISETKIKIDKTIFVKVNAAKDEDRELIVEELLFKGTYQTGDGKKVELKKNGTLLGFSEFYYYRVMDDYYDVGSQVDQLLLGKSKTDAEPFGFKFNNDTLKIYQLNCLAFDSTSNTCGIVEFGALKFVLVKEKSGH